MTTSPRAGRQAVDTIERGGFGPIEQAAFGVGQAHRSRIVEHDRHVLLAAERGQQRRHPGQPQQRLRQRQGKQRKQRHPQQHQQLVLQTGPAGRLEKLLVEEGRGRKDDLVATPGTAQVQQQRNRRRQQTEQKPGGHERHSREKTFPIVETVLVPCC